MGVNRVDPMESFILEPHEKILKLLPEHHVRRTKDGRHVAYLCEDKVGSRVILTQKLPVLASYISSLCDCKADQITTPSLYRILSVPDGSGLSHGYSKHRWRVRAFALEDVIDAFESLRPAHAEAVVLGSSRCMEKQPCGVAVV